MAEVDFPGPEKDIDPGSAPGEQRAVLAGGCFWCTEAVYQAIDGVLGVKSGYAGGDAATANYEAVCSGRTNHAEAIEIRFDPSRVSYGQLLKVFFSVAHNPTQLNHQGNDQGRQYRSAIFYTDAAQHDVAESYIRQLDAAKLFPAKIVTTLEPLEKFHEAESYHQDYVARNPDQPYVCMVALPKLEKLRKLYPGRLKT